MNKTFLFPWQRLREIAETILRASGSPAEEAGLIAGRLVKANLTGHDSHGLIRLHQYMQWVRDGMIRPGQQPTLQMDNGAVAVVTGHRGYGQTVATEGMRVAISRAREHHVAAVGVTDLNHIGRLADYAVMAADSGMIGMVYTSTGGYSTLVAPFGGAERRLSTNPMAVAFPSDREDPIVFDFASSAYAEGKFRVMRDAHMETPPNILIDPEGKPSTDPEDLYAGGAILTLGGAQGYKGYMLNFMMEVLGGLLTGGGYLGKTKEKPPFNNCSMMIVLNVAAFRELPAFKSELEGFIDYLKATKPAGTGGVLYPGEKEAVKEAERKRLGIPLAEDTVAAIQEDLDRYELATRLADYGTETAEPAWKFGP